MSAFNRDARQGKILESFVGGRLGIIRQLYELVREPDAPDLFTYVAQLSDIEAFHFQGCGKLTTGIGTRRTMARNAAIGEAVERYCGCFYDPGSILTGTCEELTAKGYAVCPPHRFALYSRRQHKEGNLYPPFSEQTRTGWTRGWSLTEEKEIWVPAAFVYLPYQFKPGEVQVAGQISTGMACAFDYPTAIMSAVCEVVEREALMIAWLQDLSFEEIDPAGLDRLDALYRERFFSQGYRLYLGKVPHDLGLNTVAALLVDKGRRIAATGSSTKPGLPAAAEKALLEAVQVRELVKSLSGGEPPKFHIEIWQQRIDELAQRFTGAPTTGTSPEVSLKELISTCKENGLQVIAVDLTTPDVADGGLCVVRVLIPEAVPLSRDFQAPCLGGRRIYEVPGHIGFPVRNEGELNLHPHPFG